MSREELERLVRDSKNRKATAVEKEAQRRSFAYGNTHFENERITKRTVAAAAESLKLGGNEKN